MPGTSPSRRVSVEPSSSLTPARGRLRQAKRVVVKIGSSLLRHDDRDPFAHFAAEIMSIRRQGKEVVLVSSGSIALGLESLNLTTRPTDLPSLQAAAACGQSHLMSHWAQAFQWFGVRVAQLLVTHDDLKDRRRWQNARKTLRVLLSQGIIPIVNENDTVGIAEVKLGDNDTLAAATAGLVDADTVVLLTSAPGLYTADPTQDPSARRVPEVATLNAEVKALAGGASTFGTGGMVTKLEAAAVARRHGAQTVIAQGNTPTVLEQIFRGDDVGTVVTATTKDRIRGRKRWIASLKPRGVVHVDKGAARALRKDGSLLFAGVTAVEGQFGAGDVVVVACEDAPLARGLAAADADVARKVMGHTSEEARERQPDVPDELIHRDELILGA